MVCSWRLRISLRQLRISPYFFFMFFRPIAFLMLQKKCTHFHKRSVQRNVGLFYHALQNSSSLHSLPNSYIFRYLSWCPASRYPHQFVFYCCIINITNVVALNCTGSSDLYTSLRLGIKPLQPLSFPNASNNGVHQQLSESPVFRNSSSPNLSNTCDVAHPGPSAFPSTGSLLVKDWDSVPLQHERGVSSTYR